MHKKRFGALGQSLALCLSCSVAALAGAQGLDPSKLSLERTPLDAAKAPIANGQNRIEIFVELESPSVAGFVVNELAATEAEPTVERQLAHAEKIRAEQAAIRSKLEKLGAVEVKSFKAGVNGSKWQVNRRDLATIQSLVGVKRVMRIAEHKLLNDVSVPWIGATDAWAEGFSGAGTKIAVIDTGVDYAHLNFGGDGNYEGNDPTTIEPGTFPTGKVTRGYDFAGTNYHAGGTPEQRIPQPDPDPMDYNGHGTHVAGSAAGNGVEGKVGAGVAKDAEIWALKVFGDVAGSTNLTVDAIEYALDPNGDGSVDDRADVINMSLGSDFGHPDDPSSVAADNASKMGVVVVVAAGNAGNGVPYVLGAPSAGEDVISVAASVAGGAKEFAVKINSDQVGGDYRAAYAAISPPLEEGNVLEGPLEIASPLNACTPLANDMTGKVAFLQRGACAFTTKLQNAKDAGAVAALVFNNVEGAPIIMGGSPVDLAGAMISLTEGANIYGAISGGDMPEGVFDAANLVEFPEDDDTLAAFSSRGPNGGSSSFKPDVSAPGVGISSAAARSGDGASSLSGTSMATPHVAGAAAVLVQKFPQLKPNAIKAMLQNSSHPANIAGPGSNTPYPLTLQGTGVINVGEAAKLTSYIQPGAISFGRINEDRDSRVFELVMLKNMSGSSRSYNVTHVPNRALPGVTLDFPSRVHVGRNMKRPVMVSMKIDASELPADDAFVSQTEVDGWLIFDDGEDKLTVGYLAVVDPASRVRARKDPRGNFVLHNQGQGMGIAEGFTLAGEGGLLLDDAPNAIKALGWRTADFGTPVLQFGLATEQPWNNLSSLWSAMYIDTDEDGIDDYILYTYDLGWLQGASDPSGQMVTALQNLNTGSFLLEYLVANDYNDASAIHTVELYGDYGFLTEGDTTFNYWFESYDQTNGDAVDVQYGSIDLANEIKLEASSVAIDPRSRVKIERVSGSGDYMWLLPNNQAKRQVEID
ncbi:S8 family serine peptidase [Simiduia agarivorans]|uniref:Subtilisin family peptidase n=1 Tax=Simiduia agarivorans (strain DSM 21679 / JCM 13881 / BCRC 17597 / SA1) TaxID=1117647 RepID=K4KPH9_SIMAS|nr:S8 family serine peptidase [Simiduia agarivorans]AFV00141.1 putative subtilisin family peptidase [Simiduia agarivorans SA1 = DSM 21679]